MASFCGMADDLRVTGGAEDLPGSIQYGFSSGVQFPPLNAIDKADSLYVIRSKGPTVIRFDATEWIELQGVRMKR